MYRYNAIDEDNIRRVWGQAPTKHQAKEQCELALKEYLETRVWYKNKKYKIVEEKNLKYLY